MKRIALCIGNDAYSILPALNCAIADATAMEKELKDLGFDTELRTDLDRTGLADAIFSFADKIENYDAALIYYAGHGFQVDGDNILAPIELDIQVSLCDGVHICSTHPVSVDGFLRCSYHLSVH